MSFEHNVFFIGPDGFREHIKSIKETAEDLAAGREAVLSILTEIGAVPDTRPVESRAKTGPSKLDKYVNQKSEDKEPFVPSTEPETQEETVAKLQESGMLSESETQEVAKSVGVKPPSKFAKIAAKTETPAQQADILKPSKLAKYAKPEKG